MTVPPPKNSSISIQFALGWAFLTILASGCSRPLYDRPSFLNSRDPNIDRARYERFDPLPDETLAPDTFSRPRGYETQRTRARQAAESRLLPIERLPPPDGVSSRPYDGVVRD